MSGGRARPLTVLLRLRALVLAAALILAVPAYAQLVADGWLHAPGTLPTQGTPMSAAGPSPTGWWVAAGSSRLYGLPDLDGTWFLVGKSLIVKGLPVGIQFLHESLGGESPHLVTRRLRTTWGAKRGFGVAWSTGEWRITGYRVPGWSRVVLSVFGDFAVGDGRLLRVEVRKLVPGASGGVTAATPPEPMGSVLLADGGTSVMLDLTRDREGAPVVALEVAALLHDRAVLGLRYDGGTGAVGPCLWLHRGGLLVATSSLVHPVLGTTHRFMIGWGAWRRWRRW